MGLIMIFCYVMIKKMLIVLFYLMLQMVLINRIIFYLILFSLLNAICKEMVALIIQIMVYGKSFIGICIDHEVLMIILSCLIYGS